MVSDIDAGDRGQLILIGSLLLAVTIIGSIVLLNSIHESPDVYTQQESQSLEEGERVVEEVRDNLERVFLVNSSVAQVGEPLPYANESAFGAIVEEYEQQYTNLSTVHSAGLVQVEHVGGQTGGIARQEPTANGYRSFPSGTVIVGADAIPTLDLFINETSSPDPFIVEIAGDTDSVEMEIDETGVSGVVSCPLNDFDGINIHLTDGSGSITTGEAYCDVQGIDSGLSGSLTVSFENGDNADGTYTITGATPLSPPGVDRSPDGRWYMAGPYLVNPEFDVQYRNPDLSYSSTFELYNRTEQ